MIQLNFELLTLQVYVSSKDQVPVPRYFLRGLLYQLLALYEDSSIKLVHKRPKITARLDSYGKISEVKEEEFVPSAADYAGYRHEQQKAQFKIPDDLYISLNSKDFVNLKKLEDENTDHTITAYPLSDDKIDKGAPYTLPTQSFKKISFNKHIETMRKVFISYSKKDLKLVNTFLDHLSSLRREKLISTWYCTELKPGEVWDEVIQKQFEESDIIFFMVSHNFLKTDYIYKNELKKAIDRAKNDNKFHIVPIILDFCSWKTSVNNYNLGDFNALPYTAKPVKDFNNQNAAWMIITECLRYMIKKNKYPTDKDIKKNDFYSDTALRPLFERIVNGKLDNNS